MAKPSPTALALSEVVIEVFRVNGLALAAGDVLGAPAGLSSARWQVLGVVDHGAAPVAHIARAMGLARQSVRITANALVRDGFVAFEPNPHHRTAKLVAITPAGRAALRRLEACHARWAARLGAKVGLEELREVLAGLRRVRTALETEPADRAEG